MRAIAGCFLGLAVLATLSGCASQGNACAGQTTGACITLEISGPSGAKVDKLIIDASDAFTGERTSAFGSPERLPVRVGVVPPSTAMTGSQVDFTVTGLLDGVTVGVGTGSDTLSADDRDVVPIELVGSSADAGMLLDAGDMADGGEPQACTDDGAIVGCSSDGNDVLTCKQGVVTGDSCALGCGGTGSAAHCKQFVPHLPVSASTLAGAPSGTPSLSGTVTINTDTGEFGTERNGMDAGAMQVVNNIGFQIIGHSAVFTMASLTIEQDAAVTVVGSNTLVIAASGSITVRGSIDARGWGLNSGTLTLCYENSAGPGGGSGGYLTTPNGSPPPGLTNMSGGDQGSGVAGAPGGGGGAGGGNADKGGIGGPGNADGTAVGLPVAGGAEVSLGDPFPGPIAGGGGGGACVGGADSGGGGGGAVHLVAGVSIGIGETGGGTSIMPEGINVSGCGGFGQSTDGAAVNAPAGGGAGGTILLEAPTVTLGAGTALTANGGAGGGQNGEGANSSLGAPPPMGTTNGGTCAQSGGGGGGAMSGSPLVGGAGGAGASSMGNAQEGGAGGGAAGRIIILNASGSNSVGTANISPFIGAKTAGGDPASYFGKVTAE